MCVCGIVGLLLFYPVGYVWYLLFGIVLSGWLCAVCLYGIVGLLLFCAGWSISISCRLPMCVWCAWLPCLFAFMRVHYVCVWRVGVILYTSRMLYVCLRVCVYVCVSIF